MATVYLAQDRKLGRAVALKVLRPELAAALGSDRFLREIEIAARLAHPHILALHDCGDAEGLLYYTMPFVAGESLRDRLAGEKQLPLDEALRISREVADALGYAHSLGLVHRDIKPENILFQAGHAVVSDFGIARAVSAAGGTRLTETGLAIGTPAYMSPEQATGSKDVDGRSDLYSLGCVLYEMLSGETPYTGPTAQAILAKKLNEPLPRISVVREAVPAGVEAALAKALARTPADRFATAAQFADALTHPAAVATPSRSTVPAARRGLKLLGGLPRWTKWAAGVAGVTALAGFGIQLLVYRPLNITVSDVTPVTSEAGVEFEPAISPDGQEVAYVAGSIELPHLFVRSTVNRAGEAAISLGDTTRGSQWLPVWSPDGQSIRFIDCEAGGFNPRSRCSLKEVGKLGGAVRPVAVPRSTRWTWYPDGTRVAFARWPMIFTSSATDTFEHRVVDLRPQGAGDAHSLAWSPDGRRIAFVNGNSLWRTGANSDMSRIWVVDAAGGELWPVATSPALNVSPVWLDAHHLLFVSNRDGPRAVYVVDVGAHGSRGAPRAVPGIADPHSISYSASARRLAFARFTNRQNIWAYPLDRSSPVSIRDGRPVTTGAQGIEEHDVSPDGKWIAYDAGLRGQMDLYKIPAAGGEAVTLANFPGGEAFEPRWSPDGREIAFWGGNVSGISVLPAEGGSPTVLTQVRQGANWDAAWSPDGLTISFYSDRAGHFQTWALSRDSVGATWHEPRVLVDSAYVAAWAPDGSGALIPGDRELPNSTFDFVSPQGRKLWHRDLAAMYGLTLLAGRARYSRDGRTIFAAGVHRDGRRGVWAIPARGGSARLVVAFDDPALSSPGYLSVGPDRLYLTVAEYESDIWVATLNW